jgi:hypothetical protein
VILEVAEFEHLQRVAKFQSRTAQQQAEHFVRGGLRACACDVSWDLTAAQTAAARPPGLARTPAEDEFAPEPAA